MKFTLARRVQGSDASAKGNLPSKDESGATPPSSSGVNAGPTPPTDNLVASGFDEQDAPEYGRIEAFDGRYLCGWYFDKIKQQRGLAIMFDDKVLCGTLADRSRMDVVGANPQAPERCGFFADLGRFSIIDRCVDLGDLYTRMKVVTTSGAQLAHCYSDPFATVDAVVGTTQPMSSLDGVERGVVNGWAVSSKRNSPVLIHVLVDGLLQGAARTNLPRRNRSRRRGRWRTPRD